MSRNTEYKNRFAAEKYDRVGLMLKKGSPRAVQKGYGKRYRTLTVHSKFEYDG